MWLGEQITERVSATVFQSLSSPVLSRDSRHHCPYYRASASRRPALPRVAVVAVLVFAVTFFVVFVERGQAALW